MFAVIAFAEGFIFCLSLCFDLGMVNVALIKTGMERGFRPSFMIGFGSCFGDLFYLALALLGVSVVFEFAPVKWALWAIGSCVLFYLTYKMLRETWRPKDTANGEGTSNEPNLSLWKDYWNGIALALSSPTSIAWFAFVAGPIIAGSHMKQDGGIPFFVAGFFSAGLVWSFSVALISSLSGSMMKPSISRGLSLVSAAMFLYFAVKVFYQGLSDLF
ncbi:LysE family translocator [Cohnella suwonensis]|uniref:LysE family translocator n=1 Tax=Cohnella suwonensis TaxID=696072 RepID=A0ABW0M1M2_9BACL